MTGYREVHRRRLHDVSSSSRLQTCILVQAEKQRGSSSHASDMLTEKRGPGVSDFCRLRRGQHEDEKEEEGPGTVLFVLPRTFFSGERQRNQGQKTDTEKQREEHQNTDNPDSRTMDELGQESGDEEERAKTQSTSRHTQGTKAQREAKQ